MLKTVTAVAACALARSACTGSTYTDKNGQFKIEPAYPQGSAVVYEDGRYDMDMRNGEYRPALKVRRPNSGGLRGDDQIGH